MSARQQSSQRVQELLRIAEATKGWGSRMGSKKAYFTTPDGARLELPLNPGEKFLKEFEADAAKRGLPMEAPKSPAHPDGNGKTPIRNAAMIKRFDSMDEVERAQAVWLAAVNYAKKNEVEVTTIDGVDFYKVDKPLSYFISMEFGQGLPYQGERQCSKPIYSFLRGMANAIHYTANHQEATDRAANGYWLIRTEWNAALTVVFRSPRRNDSIDRRAARLTAHEAGEDREPGPVTITTATPTTPETPMPRKTQDKPAEERTTPYSQFKTDQGFQCPECKAQGTERFIKNAQGLAAHRTWAHGIHPGGAQAKGGEDGSPLTEVNLAMELLRSEIDKVLSGTGDEEALAQARQEADQAAKAATEAQTQATHQRKRAEAAEGTLKAIREALETLPMTQAFAKIAEVTPHFEG